MAARWGRWDVVVSGRAWRSKPEPRLAPPAHRGFLATAAVAVLVRRTRSSRGLRTGSVYVCAPRGGGEGGPHVWTSVVVYHAVTIVTYPVIAMTEPCYLSGFYGGAEKCNVAILQFTDVRSSLRGFSRPPNGLPALLMQW